MLLVRKLSELAYPLTAKEKYIWEVAAISRADQRSDDVLNDVNTFDTGLTVQPPSGYYIELHTPKELLEKGYHILGGVMTRFWSDDEPLVIPLLKFHEGEDLELPATVAVMILRKLEPVELSMHGKEKPATSKVNNVPKKKGTSFS